MTKMKTKMIKSSLFLLVFFAGCSTAFSQNSVKEQLTIPLSDPGKSGVLKVGLISGSIHVTGYTGKQVVVDVSSEENSEKKEGNKKDEMASGMRKISSGGGLEITAEEDKNTVTIKTGLNRKKLNLMIKVPQQFALKLSAVNNGDITVDNVNGEMEITNVNGEIILTNVSGSAVANTVNGDLKANFKTTNADTPMAFSTLNGNVDITFPANAKFNAKLKSDRGEIYSDFDMNIEKGKQQTSRSAKEGMYKISIEDWVKGSVNGGGSEVMMKNMNGNIYIRKAK